MKKPIHLDRELISRTLPEMPADFRERMEQMIDRLPTERKGPIMKRKLSMGLVLAIVLALLTVGAVAAVLLTPQQVVEQTAVPMAVGNNTEIRNVNTFSPDELAAFISAAAENGITLDENSSIMQALRKGEGYWEDEAIRAVCKQAFGQQMDEWTMEQQSWYQDVLAAISEMESAEFVMPGEGDVSEAEALALGMAAVRAQYGEDLPLDDPAVYGIGRSFSRWADPETHNHWELIFRPRDLWHGEYTISILDGAPAAIWDDPGNDPEDYSAQALLSRMYRIAGYSPAYWTPEQWVTFSEVLRGGAMPAADDYDADLIRGIRASEYLLPGTDDISQAQAYAIASPDCDPVFLHCAILLGNGEQHIWRVCEWEHRRFWEIDARTGEILRTGTLNQDSVNVAAFVLSATYEQLFPKGEELTEDDLLKKAIGLLCEAGGELPLEDEASYQVYSWKERQGDDRVYVFRFAPKSLEWPCARAEITVEGKAKLIQVDRSGDGLMARFTDVYGWRGDWDQSVWVRLGEMMQDAQVETDRGRLLKATTFPAVSDGLIPREKAVDIAIAHSGDRNAEDNGVVLLGGEPNPIWKVHLVCYTALGIRNYEIDAVTGEVLSFDPRVPDHPVDPAWKDYIPRAVYTADLMAHDGLVTLARWAAIYRFGNMEYDDCDTYLTEDGFFTATVDGLTVTFARIDGDGPVYVVTMGEDGLPVSVDRIGEPENRNGPDGGWG